MTRLACIARVATPVGSQETGGECITGSGRVVDAVDGDCGDLDR